MSTSPERSQLAVRVRYAITAGCPALEVTMVPGKRSDPESDQCSSIGRQETLGIEDDVGEKLAFDRLDLGYNV